MAALNLFPARVRFVNDDGTLTNEAYRALQIVFNRVGGALGDSGADVFRQVFGAPTDSDNNLSNALSDVVQTVLSGSDFYTELSQPVNFGADFYSDVVQYQASSKDFIGLMLPEVMQPVTDQSGVFSTLAVSGNASIGGTLRLAAGTVGLPSLYWSTDTTTGFYRIGANNNGYAVSGVKLLDFLSTGLAITGTASATGGLNSTAVGNVTPSTGSFTTGAFSGLLSNTRASGADTYFSHGTSGVNNTVVGFNNSGAPNANNVPNNTCYYGSLNGYNTVITNGTVNIATFGSTGVAVVGALSSTGSLTTVGGATFHTTSTALTNGAGVGAGTITNAPATGNPTKWIGINDNGTVRYLPAW